MFACVHAQYDCGTFTCSKTDSDGYVFIPFSLEFLSPIGTVPYSRGEHGPMQTLDCTYIILRLFAGEYVSVTWNKNGVTESPFTVSVCRLTRR